MSQQSRPVLSLPMVAVGGAVAYGRAVAMAVSTLMGAYGGTQATVAGQKVIGIARRDAAVGATFDATCLGSEICEAGAAIPINSRVQVDALGRVIVATAATIAAGATAVTSAAANGAGTLAGGDLPVFVFGTALQAAGAAGEFIEVLICP